MSEETREERQNNEYGALMAIFGKDLVDCRKNVWNNWKPLDLFLTLYPLHSSSVPGVHCSITLNIRCCHKYPDVPPTLEIHELSGLSNENAAKLLSELTNLVQNLCGEVMIYEIAQHAQNFLHIYNKPTSKSFYDEMLQQQKESHELKLQNLQIKENNERQKIQDELMRRREILKAEGRFNREHRNSSCQQDEELVEDIAMDNESHLICYAEATQSPLGVREEESTKLPCDCECTSSRLLELNTRGPRKVYLGKCLGHSSLGHITYGGLDTENGKMQIIREWKLPNTIEHNVWEKHIFAIEKELDKIYKLTCKYITPYTAMGIQQHKNGAYVHLLRDFLHGISVKQAQIQCTAFYKGVDGLSAVRKLASGVLSGLVVLHRVKVAHRDVCAENVFLESSGAVRLVGVSLDQRLRDLRKETSTIDSFNEKRDIVGMGTLLVSLMCGVSARKNTIIPPELPRFAKDFLSKCASGESARRLLTHEFVSGRPLQEPSRDPDDGYSGSEEEHRAFLGMEKLTHGLPPVGHSRINDEFEVLKWLGRGAFGDVVKVRNKLDGGFYAIKRIQLNPKSKQLNKKITREVKLLSRLNHENVVRYYNAWIETVESPIEKQDTNTEESTSDPDGSTERALAKLTPGATCRLEWSSKSKTPMRATAPTVDSSSEESSDDDDDGWFKFLPPSNDSSDEESCSIEFEGELDDCPIDAQQESNSQSGTLEPSSANLLQVESRINNEGCKVECEGELKICPINPQEESNSQSGALEPSSANLSQVLYIQMEFCEKNTLRQAIDAGLYSDGVRAWRLFREIVEGLAHVHQRGMIHRDLKPVNIFLDSNDHVKIGDFGLATKAFPGQSFLPNQSESENMKYSEDFGDGSLTGQVGTALYVAPELIQSTNKMIYNQKVDIYSLGIILFEMWHPRLETGMERMKILTKLRCKEIEMPDNFQTPENDKQIRVIRWMLSHEPSTRPSCAELLASEHVPRALADGILAGLLAHTLADRGSRAYRRLLAACLDRRLGAAEELTWDAGARKRPCENEGAARDAVVKALRLHGAVELIPPLLTPRAKAWDEKPGAVRMMAAAGDVVHLPRDLRLPFARHVAFSGINNARRYAVDRVFRERRVPGFHPRELLECAFDIVTPKPGNLWADAEVLSAACAAARSAGAARLDVQLNHTLLLRSVLAACGVAEDRYEDALAVLADLRGGRLARAQLHTRLTSLCLGKSGTTLLLRLTETETPISRAREALANLLNVRKDAGALATLALNHLETVSRNAEALGADCTMTVVPCLAFEVSQHDGVVWQASVDSRGRRGSVSAAGGRRSGDVLAVGGRYDALVASFAVSARQAGLDVQAPSAVGFSLSLERLAAAVANSQSQPLTPALESDMSVCVCMCGGSDRADRACSQLARLACSLRAAGVSVITLECVREDDARDVTGVRIVLAVDEGNFNAVKMTLWDRDRVTERRIPYSEAVDVICQKLKPDSNRQSENGPVRSASVGDSPQYTVTVVTPGNLRKSAPERRRYEAQASNAASATLSSLGMRRRVCVMAVLACGSSVRCLAANIDAPISERDLKRALNVAVEQFPKQRELLSEVVEIAGGLLTSSSEPPLLAFYSLNDGVFRLIH